LEFDNFLFQQTQAPFCVARRRWPTRQRDRLGFRHTIENPSSGRVGIGFTGQNSLKTFLNLLPPRSLDGGDASIQSLGNPAIAPAFASL